MDVSVETSAVAECSVQIARLREQWAASGCARWDLPVLLGLSTSLRWMGAESTAVDTQVEATLFGAVSSRRGSKAHAELFRSLRRMAAAPPDHGARRIEALSFLVGGLTLRRGRRVRAHVVEAFVRAGDLAGASAQVACAALGNDRVLARDIVETGISPCGAFVAPLTPECVRGVRPSVPMIEAFAEAAIHGDERPELASWAMDAFEALPERALDGARVPLAAMAHARHGLDAAHGVIRAIRPRSLRSAAQLAVVRAALARNERDDAFMVAAGMRGLRADRAWIAIAEHLTAEGHVRGNLTAARVLLARAANPRSASARALAMAGIETAERQFIAADTRIHAVRRAAKGHREERELGAHADAARLRLALACTLGGLRQIDVQLLSWLPSITRTAEGFSAFVRSLPPSERPHLPRIFPRRGVAATAALSRWWTHRMKTALRSAAAPELAEERLAHGLGLSGAAPRAPWGDAPLSALRAIYDEGVARSPRAARRRAVLIRAAKHCLRVALCAPDDVSSRAFESRLRSLSTFGREGAPSVLSRLLFEAPISARFERALLALALLDADAATTVLNRRFVDLASEDRARALVIQLEGLGALEPGHAVAWDDLVGVIRHRATPEAAEAWLRAAERSIRPWTPAAMRGLAAMARRHVAAPGVALPSAASLEKRGRGQLRLHDDDAAHTWIGALLESPTLTELSLWLRPPSLGSRPVSWPREEWRAAFERLSEIGVVDARVIDELLHRLPRRASLPSLRRTFLRGQCPSASELLPLPLPRERPAMRLRYLDKRKDFLTHLRFTDVASSCFDTADGFNDWVLMLFKDPLSFAYHLEIERDARWSPVGFVFGGWALVGRKRQPALLLNGLYFRRQTKPVRAATLRALEESLARHVGVRHVGVASSHGGAGPLPDDYQARALPIVRLRALARAIVYDDICNIANTPCTVDHLFWKRL